MCANAISIEDIHNARQRLAAYIRCTPVNESPSLGQVTNCPVYLKLEHHQITGSFKIRGASNAVGQLTHKQRQAGVVCVSTGNHGRGIAFAAQQAGVEAHVFMSSLVPENKVNAIAELGADIRIVGTSQDEAESEALEYCQQSGAVYLPPFDHRDIICGQGTLGMEIVEQVPGVESILVPLSGGGLIGGIALAVRALNPDCRLIGISMEIGAAMIESQRAGKPVPVQELPTFADSLGGGIGLNNQYTFDLVNDLIDETLQVSEGEIADAVRHAYFQEKQIIEGGASVGIAGILAGKVELHGPAVVLLSGCNIDMQLHKAILDGIDCLNQIR